MVLTTIQQYGVCSGIILNLQKSNVLCLNSSQKGLYDPFIQTVDYIKILGIKWTPTLSTTISLNATGYIGKIVSLLQAYKFLFHSLAGRIYFINTFIYSQLYFFLQILPFHAKHYALIRKFVGYFLWQTSTLRISHTTLTLPFNQGGQQLKDLQLQGLALRIHRALLVLCNYQATFSYAYLQMVLYHIDTVAPLNI